MLDWYSLVDYRQVITYFQPFSPIAIVDLLLVRPIRQRNHPLLCKVHMVELSQPYHGAVCAVGDIGGHCILMIALEHPPGKMRHRRSQERINKTNVQLTQLSDRVLLALVRSLQIFSFNGHEHL